MKILLFVVMILPVWAWAENKCDWTPPAMEADFAPPQIVKATCGKPDDAPTCVGHMYCQEESGNIPPAATVVSCTAIKVAGKFQCPDARACSGAPAAACDGRDLRRDVATVKPGAVTNFDHIFVCKVLGFDKKEVKGQCDPSRPKNTMKIPREWLGDDDGIKLNNRIKFSLDDRQFEKWLTMNKIEVRNRKSK